MWTKFSKEGLLIAALQSHYCSSSFPSYVRLILITEKYSAKAEVWGLVQRNLERLQCNSKESAIIYIGPELDALPAELADRTVAHSPFDSFLYYFDDVLPEPFYHSPGVLAASTIITLERNTVKYLSTWEEISYISDEFEFLTRTPGGSNVDLLRRETPESDFLLYNDEQIQVKLKDKVGLLFIKIAALEDVYLKLHGNSNYPVEVVWVPKVETYIRPEEYNKAATSAPPWPMVLKPWLIWWRTSWVEYGKCLIAVDEQGSRSHKDEMQMILRWGLKAYSFSTSPDMMWHGDSQNERSLTSALNPLRNLFFKIWNSSKLLTNAFTMLKNVIQVFYIAEKTVYNAFGSMSTERC